MESNRIFIGILMRQHHFSIFRPGTRIRMEIITGTRNLIGSIGIGETLNSSDVL